MTEAEMITLVGQMSGESSESIVSAFINIAGHAIINRAYPFATEKELETITVPIRYQMLQCEIAVFLLNKRGAEGQTSHSENGIGRTYENGDIPDSMLKQVVPFCKAL